MLFLYLHTGFIHRLGSAVCWPTECNAVPLFLNLSLSVSISLPCTPSSPFSRSSPPPSLSVSVFRSLSLSFSNPLSVSVSFSFQAWNHLIIAYSSFGRLLNAHLSKPGGNNLPWDITHTHMHARAHTCRLQGEDLLQQVHPQFTEIYHQSQIEETFQGGKK